MSLMCRWIYRSVTKMCSLKVSCFVVAALFGSVLGGNPCCMPDQWTANLVQSLGEYNQDLDSASLAYGNTDYFYDSAGNQTAYKQKLDNQTAHTMTDLWVIMKYQTGKKYIIQSGKCQTVDLIGQILPRCIPGDATFLGTHFYPGSIKVDLWLFMDQTNGETRRIGLTQPDCLPITMSGLTPPPDFILSMNLFQNVTKGIMDPSIFVVPPSCK